MNPAGPADMPFVSPFLRNAHEIFAAARQGAEDCHMAILVEPDGAIHMCSSEDWDLECLRRHHGAAVVYGVTRCGTRVRVEGRSLAEQCTLETSSAGRLAGIGIGNFPQYRLVA